MKVRLYNFYKRENSTAQPSATGGYEYDCVLKNDTSIVNPVIIIDFADQEDPEPHIFNYAYIKDFNRYYFVADVSALRGVIWQYSLTVDILATYKQTLSAQYLYLLRCSGTFDGTVPDTYYPVKTTYTQSYVETQTPWLHTIEEDPDVSLGCFILGIVSRPGASMSGTYGSIKYIAMDRRNLCDLINYLMDGNNLITGDITLDGVTNEAAKSLIDPIGFIKSCQWCPLLYEDIPGYEYTGLNIWSWNADDVSYKNMPNNPPYFKWSASFASVPRHPQAAARGAYLNTEPYTKMCVVIPPFGVIDIDTTLAASVNQIIGLITYDMITGSGILEIHYGNVKSIPACRMQTQIGVDIQLTQVTRDYLGGAVSLAGGAMGAFGSLISGQIGGAIMGGLSAIGSAVSAMKPVQSSVGGSGGFADLRGKAYLYAVFYDIPEEDRAHVGRPLCKEVNMFNVPAGTYCLAMDGDIPINGTAGEQARLRAYLEGGFYYE